MLSQSKSWDPGKGMETTERMSLGIWGLQVLRMLRTYRDGSFLHIKDYHFSLLEDDAKASPPWQQVFPSGKHPNSLQVIKLVTEVKSQCNPTGDVLGLIREKRNNAPMEWHKLLNMYC